MTIPQFIEKAIEGEYSCPYGETADEILGNYDFKIEQILLDPLAWKAVGKSKEWTTSQTYEAFTSLSVALWDNVSIEQYLETL